MKYLYKAMENLGESNGNVILGWHEKVSTIARGARMKGDVDGV
jgi:actin related protein 2/3 complex subunit 5